MRVRMRLGQVLATLLIATAVSSAAWAETLTVALYPYVPRIDQFETAIRDAWRKVHPTDQLNFINDMNIWDGGYKKDPPANADVYVFDAMYFEDFVSRELLVAMEPSEVKNAGDFLDYARKAVMTGDKYYAIPQLGCANILFYQASDHEVANATTLPQLQSSLKQCTYTSEVPPDRRGLMVDMNGSTTIATLYLDIAHSMNGTYPLPEPGAPDKKVTDDQRLMLTLGSYLNATSNNETPYVRGTWFNQGYGRAFMGFTEAMWVMSEQMLSNIGFKVMPLSGTTGKPPLFYADVIGVNKTTEGRGTRARAVELANVIAATETIVASFKAQNGKNPQYLMSVRTSAFETLEKEYPIYKKMHDLTKSNPAAFKLDKAGRAWVKNTAPVIRQQVRANYNCGCDQTAPRAIANNVDAQGVCPAVCQTHGGWSGQWTNQPPAPQPSVCGCNACPVPQ
jgi:thiamine pyridinylase